MDLSQLVDTMVSYSVTYQNSKPEALALPQRHGGPSPDAPAFSFDPPIGELVNFKVFLPSTRLIALVARVPSSCGVQ